jgi:hypothetical protein
LLRLAADARGQDCLMLMMAEFFGPVNAYRDAMLPRVHAKTPPA